jgi:Leucine-rich repeat (LRR) protein
MNKRYIIATFILLSVFFPLSLQLHAQVPAQDSLALVALYNNTNGDGWTNHTNWMISEVSTWYGITVTGNRVSAIVLNNNNLSGPLPAVIGDLTGLTDIQMFNNELTGSLPSTIGNLVNLQSIYISSNYLSGPIPPEIGNLTDLVSLNIGGNSFSGELPAELGNLESLSSLIITNCQITGPLPEEIGNLTNLNSINLYGNDLTGSIPESIGNLPNLYQLSLAYNQLSGDIPAGILNSSLIFELILSGNQFTGTIPAGIGNMSGLDVLSLDYNQFTGAIPPEMGNLSNMRWLELSGNLLTGAVPDEFQNLSSLVDMRISNNQLTDLPDLSALPDLAALYIQDNRFTFEDIEPNTSIPAFVYSPQANVGIPLDTTLQVGSDFTLSVSVGGTFNEYQWYKNEILISGADEDSYPLTSITMADSGSYTCQITNTLFTELTLYSNPVTINVVPSFRELDSLALVAIYNTMGGENWNDRTNWLTAEPIDNWYGITVTGNRVVQINLGGNHLTGTLPEEIGQLTELTNLILYGNVIEGSLPSSITNLTKLWELVLNGNHLTGPIPPEVCTMYTLRALNFVGNQMSGSIPAEIGNLTNLEYLNLGNNQFSGPIPAGIGNLTKLTSLSLNTNQLSGSLPDTLGNLINLSYLNLSENQLLGTIPGRIGDLSNLTTIYLSNNLIFGTIPSEIGNLINLHSLFLNDNLLLGAIPEEITDITGLRDLGIENNGLEDLPDLSSLGELQWLVVLNNRFTFEDIEPNINVAHESFLYSPQDSVGVSADTTVTIGTNLEITVNVGGTANQYQWIKDGTAIPGAENSTYVISSAQLADNGVYNCEISNTIATDLTLYSRPVTVTVTEASGIADISPALPVEYALFQNYPNPFNPLTRIRFALPAAEQVQIIIYNLLGQEIVTILNEKRNAGYHTVAFDAGHLATGVYFYAIRAGHFQAINKMLLVR